MSLKVLRFNRLTLISRVFLPVIFVLMCGQYSYAGILGTDSEYLESHRKAAALQFSKKTYFGDFISSIQFQVSSYGWRAIKYGGQKKKGLAITAAVLLIGKNLYDSGYFDTPLYLASSLYRLASSESEAPQIGETQQQKLLEQKSTASLLALTNKRRDIENRVLGHYLGKADHEKAYLAQRLFQQSSLEDYRVLTAEFLVLNIDTKVSSVCERITPLYSKDDFCVPANFTEVFFSEILPYRSGDETLEQLSAEINQRLYEIQHPIDLLSITIKRYPNATGFCNDRRWLGHTCVVLWTPYLPDYRYGISYSSERKVEFNHGGQTPAFPMFAYGHSNGIKPTPFKPFDNDKFLQQYSIHGYTLVGAQPYWTLHLTDNERHSLPLHICYQSGEELIPVLVIDKNVKEIEAPLFPGEYIVQSGQSDELACREVSASDRHVSVGE